DRRRSSGAGRNRGAVSHPGAAVPADHARGERSPRLHRCGRPGCALLCGGVAQLSGLRGRRRAHRPQRAAVRRPRAAAARGRTGAAAPGLDEVIRRLGGRALMTRLRAEPDPAQRYPAAVARLRALMESDASGTLVEGIDRLLERVALSTSDGAEVAPDRVNLLTLHSTKGLEFSR